MNETLRDHSQPGAISPIMPDAAQIAAARRSLALGTGADAPVDLIPAALAFVGRHAGDTLQIERGAAALVVALDCAWGARDHVAVARIAEGLALCASRMTDRALALRMLRRGIAASRQMGDTRRRGLLLNRLGSLRFAYGDYARGWRLWHDGVRLARDHGAVVWEPLAQFALIADLLAGREAAARFCAAIPASQPETQAVALFARGFCARAEGDRAGAEADFTRCVRLLEADGAARDGGLRRLVIFAALTELARLQGDFAQAQALAATTVALAQVYADWYTIAVLLIDQAWHAYRQGEWSAMRVAYDQLRALAIDKPPPHIYRSGRYIERELRAVAPVISVPAPLALPEIQAPPPAALTAREAEVLRLVAAGLANRDIAERLVITTATVKKHLEHSFAKLGAHSRTAAIATWAKLSAQDSPFGA